MKDPKKRAVILAVLGIIVVLIAFISVNSLTGDDKLACDLIVATAPDKFGSSSEVKLVSGGFSDNKSMFFCVLEYRGSENKYVILNSNDGSPSIYDANVWAMVAADYYGYSKNTMLAVYADEFNSKDLDIIRINQVLSRKLKK
ncbi:MAG: hypothetical protein K6C13_03965 [Oscillospiraceae bacterium]|nr:hypothetical protein [Oscillospiraceae bacterium]